VAYAPASYYFSFHPKAHPLLRSTQFAFRLSRHDSRMDDVACGGSLSCGHGPRLAHSASGDRVGVTIAVVGALIAYAGVRKTTRTTRRENRRAEKVAVLEEACAAIHELTRAVDRVAAPNRRNSARRTSQRHERRDARTWRKVLDCGYQIGSVRLRCWR
jgi:hypothetical protein